MGFLLKNPRINSHNTVMPFGPTSDREANPISGSFRFNTDATKIELYDGTRWNFISIAGLAAVVKDSFTGDAIAVDFTMSRIVTSVYDIVVFIGNIHQNPAVAYTVNGTTITFTSPPPLRNTIVVLHGLNSTTV